MTKKRGAGNNISPLFSTRPTKDCEINWSVWPFQTKGYKVIKESSNCNASKKTVPGLFEMEGGGMEGRKRTRI